MIDKDELRKASKQALGLWGLQSQIDMSIEEMSELILVLQKFFRRGSKTIRDVATEIADVEFMCDQLRCIVGDEIVDEEKAFKLKRLQARMEEFEQHIYDMNKTQ